MSVAWSLDENAVSFAAGDYDTLEESHLRELCDNDRGKRVGQKFVLSYEEVANLESFDRLILELPNPYPSNSLLAKRWRLFQRKRTTTLLKHC